MSSAIGAKTDQTGQQRGLDHPRYVIHVPEVRDVDTRRI
jgi:hypothetical protein